MTEHTAGHSVLVIPVPELDDWVRERTTHYDATFLGRDPEFVNAHITVLGPWINEPSADDLAKVTDIAASTPAFDFSLADVDAFPDGLVYLDPSPRQPFTALTAELAKAFPDHPPYGGAFESVRPHLTLDQVSDGVSVESVRQSLREAIPLTTTATRIDLQWWENDNCHVMASWPLRNLGVRNVAGIARNGIPTPQPPEPRAKGANRFPLSAETNIPAPFSAER